MHITRSDFADQAKSAEIIGVCDRQQDAQCPASLSSTADEYTETDAAFPVPVCHFLLPLQPVLDHVDHETGPFKGDIELSD